MSAVMIPETMPYTLQQIQECKDFADEHILRDLENLYKFDANTNPRKFAGSKIIYRHQLRNMLKCRRGTKGYKTIEEWFETDELKNQLWKNTIHRNRRDKAPYPSPTDIYEAHRINQGAIVSFKATTAKYVIKKFCPLDKLGPVGRRGAPFIAHKKVCHILDPCAGWGGRYIGATSMGAIYTGYDTNINMREAYEGITNDIYTHGYGDRWRLALDDSEIRFQSCLEGDFTDKPYDLVLTSPPYSNLELYEHMTPFESDKHFYETFMMPLFEKLFNETNCPICINISPTMYKDLTTTYNLKECDTKVDLRQQMGKIYKTKSQDYVYVWFPQKGADEDVNPETGEENPNLMY